MAVSPYFSDQYDAQRYYAEQERRYRAEMERNRAMQQMAYDINTDTYRGTTAVKQQEAEKPKKAAQPEYLTNDKLLLLGETS